MTQLRPLLEPFIKAKGSQSKLAEEMGCSQQQISYLLKARRVSADMAIRIEKATGGAIPRQSLRPDIFEDTL